MRTFGRVAVLVSCTQIRANKVPVTPGKVAMVDLLGRVVELMPIQMLRSRVCLAAIRRWTLIFLVESLDHATLLLRFGLGQLVHLMLGIVHFHIMLMLMLMLLVAVTDAILVVAFGPFSLRRPVRAVRVGTCGRGRAHDRLHGLRSDAVRVGLPLPL